MPVQFYNGAVLFDSNVVAMDDDCCCDSTDCCVLGETLTAEITNKTGTASTLPDTMTMTREAGQFRWNSNTVANPCAAFSGVPTWGFSLRCSFPEGWTIVGSGFSVTVSFVSVNCNTGEIRFTVSWNTGGCVGSFSVYIHP